MSDLCDVKVDLNHEQRLRIKKADFDNKIIMIRLTPYQLVKGSDTLFVGPSTKEFMNCKALNNKGCLINIFPSCYMKEEDGKMKLYYP